MDQRYSDYYALYQGIDQFVDVGDAANQIAHLVDGGVQRYRPHIVLSENMLGGVTVAEQRAAWELSRRQGRSFAVRLTTDSWRDSSGTLYTPNTLVPLALPTLKLGSAATPVRWLISEVTYKRGRTGTSCDLVLLPPQAFYQEPFILVPFPPDWKLD
jgi:prophage tail gpP-like protein